ncbi:AI-2E family transporter [Vibrio sp. SS-MA-C1-2]|uniref:AI-2E family transporter n=1 Tax=Vibrio sp. SS-MA-C1-2 TaxID=2908646 RepID=UPI001F3DCB30|nr:AI-2E family transporter [Vibrio sp. SS-MA-C1-2]UJF19075.1 AI-2E family transporter [Vibrio sp. SS-MA-C1-2]
MSKPLTIESRHWIIIAALAIAAYACYQLIAPYLGSIILAFIISILFQPIHDVINTKLINKPNIASVISCILLTFIIVIPMMFVFSAIVQQGISFSKDSYLWAKAGGVKEILAHPYVHSTLTFINNKLPFESINNQEIVQRVAEFASQLGAKMLNLSGRLLGDVTGIIANFGLMLFVLFFLLRDHNKIVHAMRHVLPLSRSQEDIILTEIESVAKSAVLGSFLTALAQGFAGGIAMGITGFPALFWGTMMGFASFIPLVGTALIWLPAAIYLLLTGQMMMAGFMVIWGIAVVGSIDNLLRPLLMQGSSSMSTLLIFFSLLGGIQLYGLLGLIYGPIIFAVTLVLFRLYETEFHDFLVSQDKS